MNFPCQCCQIKDSKYTCPACQVKTCSLECVKLHKSISGCTGKSSNLKFISKEELTEKDLLKDYVFLQEGFRIKESSNRSSSLSKSMHHHPLIKQCQQRQIELKLMPKGMKKHTHNQTKYIHQTKLISLISWNVQVELLDSQIHVLIHNRLETNSLSEIIQIALKSFKKDHKYKEEMKELDSVSLEALFIYMKRNGVAVRDPFRIFRLILYRQMRLDTIDYP